MKPFLTLALLAALAGCADDLSTRDYSVSTCPPRPAPPNDPTLCDRGADQHPRFVTLMECILEVRIPIPGTYGIGTTHPDSDRCAAMGGAVLVTIEDVRTGLINGH